MPERVWRPRPFFEQHKTLKPRGYAFTISWGWISETPTPSRTLPVCSERLLTAVLTQLISLISRPLTRFPAFLFFLTSPDWNPTPIGALSRRRAVILFSEQLQSSVGLQRGYCVVRALCPSSCFRLWSLQAFRLQLEPDDSDPPPSHRIDLTGNNWAGEGFKFSMALLDEHWLTGFYWLRKWSFFSMWPPSALLVNSMF